MVNKGMVQRAALPLLLLFACSPTLPPASAPGAGAAEASAPQASAPEKSARAAAPAAAPPAAATPVAASYAMHGLRRVDGVALSFDQLVSELVQGDLVCLGEQHDSAAHHAAQAALLRAMVAHARMSGRELALGLEMLTTDDQHALELYARGDISSRALARRVRWRENWGYPFASYRPLLTIARDGGLALLALNAPRAIVRRVAHVGVGGLGRDERYRMPELDFDSKRHRALFDVAIADHPPTHGGIERLYEAQVVWDEWMAATAARWVSDHRPSRLVVAIAGLAHCNNPAVPERFKRRTGGESRSLAPRVVQPSARGTETETGDVDYELVLTPQTE